MTQTYGTAGFAFPVVLFVLVVLSVGALFFVNGSRDERLAQTAMKDFTRTFYATDAGVNDVIARWKGTKWDTLLVNAGDSVDLGWTDLENGSRYHALARRTDSDPVRRFYSIRVTGTGPKGREGRSVRYLDMVKVPWDLNIESAVKGGSGSERFEADHNAIVSGLDVDPAGWGSTCDGIALEDKPAAVWPDMNDVEIAGAATVTGSPVQVEEDPTQNETNVFQWEDFDFDDLAALATIVFNGDQDFGSGVGPRVTGGVCDTSFKRNWGAPLDPDSPCFNYFPIILIKNGGVRIRDHSGSGQGILLVDEPGSMAVRFEDDFQWFGIIIAKGEVRFEEDSQIHGAIINADRARFERDSFTQYSGCAVERAVLGSGLYELQPMMIRAQRSAL